MATILKVDPSRPDPSVIKEAVRVLDANGVVMYPTESSYALGANALEEAAIRRVLCAKERPSSKPIPVIVSDLGMWKKYSYFNKSAETLVKKFMPGPLTIALRKKLPVPDILNPFAIAARIPSHPVARALVNETNYPITSTSANVSGKPPVYHVGQVPSRLESVVDLILDAGVLRKKKPSTIVDFTVGSEPVVTREGSVPTSAVLETLEKARRRRHARCSRRVRRGTSSTEQPSARTGQCGLNPACSRNHGGFSQEDR